MNSSIDSNKDAAATFHRRRFNFGVAASLLWVSVMVGLLLWKHNKLVDLEINQWGDFFAGAFAPLAFLWLVLGYLQQGEELRLSTSALHLQAEELQKSAEQQRQLVEVTRLQVESERESAEFARRQREAELSPNLDVRPGGGAFGVTYSYGVQLVNTGHVASALHVTVVHADGREQVVLDLASLERGKSMTFRIDLPQPLTGNAMRLHLSCRDAMGVKRTKTYAVFRDESTPNTLLQFSLIEA